MNAVFYIVGCLCGVVTTFFAMKHYNYEYDAFKHGFVYGYEQGYKEAEDMHKRAFDRIMRLSEKEKGDETECKE